MIDGVDVASLIDASSTAGTFAVILIVLLRRPAAVATLDTSVERWIERLENATDAAERRELARERNDSEHRAWDTGVLLAVALGEDAADIRKRVAKLGPPPRLSPDPAEWLDYEQRRYRHRKQAAPLAPDIDDGPDTAPQRKVRPPP